VPNLSLVPLQTTEAEAYWRVYVAGRSDLPSRSVRVHLERYLNLPVEEQRRYFSFLEDGRIVGTVHISSGPAESPEANVTGFSIDPARSDVTAAAIIKAVDFLRAQGQERIAAGYEDRYEDAFAAVGFRRWFARIRMEAAIARRPIAGEHVLRPPEEPEVLGLARFFMEAYEGHMEQAFGMHVGPESDWRQYITALLKGDSGQFMPDASFVSFDGDRLVGSILMTHWMELPLVAEIGVAKDHRRRGLGRALLQAAINRLTDHGFPRIALFVTVGNDPAVRLYESLGFAQAGGQSVTGRLE